MKYQALQQVDFQDLLSVFNQAFSDYIIPVPPMNEAVFSWKLLRDGVDQKLSSGFFTEDEHLVGFTLHAPGTWQAKPTIYNAGTGIIPPQRGQKGGRGMYDYILPLLDQAGFKQSLLECIVGNDRAFALYESVGFQRTRELICYQGKIQTSLSVPPNVSFIRHPKANWPLWESFWDWAPSWQNGNPAIGRVADTFQFIELVLDQNPVGYAIFKPDNGYLAQFAIKPEARKHGFGTLLFQHLQGQTDRPITLVNMDGGDSALHAFLKKLGMEVTVKQHEMLMKW